MNPSEEFRRHAVECQQMAKFTRDPASKATWNRMAERWLHCAEVFQRQSSAVQLSKRQHRGAADTHH